MLSWVHFGDLHVTRDDGFASVECLKKVVDSINRNLGDAVDFAYLPADNANSGTIEQNGQILAALDSLKLPVYAIPGDHDFEPGSLDNFHRALAPHNLPRSLTVHGHRCIFLDIVSSGDGGPDFRLGEAQHQWLSRELAAATTDDEPPVVFMHAYPGDLAERGEALAREFADAGVAMVDTGHTHYSELLNDGAVIYAATRSTGQIEEDDGRAGFSIATVDGGVVSWRFRRLDEAWPLVLITVPADRRLATDPADPRQVPKDDCLIRARIFGAHVSTVTAGVDGQRIPMQLVGGISGLWQAQIPVPSDAGSYRIDVKATTSDGRTASDTVEAMTPSSAARRTSIDATPGTDAHAVGEWADHGLMGAQLGPDKNGRHG